MSKERCQATKQLMKQAIAILESGSAGKGRGVSLAITYMEDAYLRMDFHMREQGWLDNGTVNAKPVSLNRTTVVQPNNSPVKAPIVAPTKAKSTLVPAAHIPQLNTGIMNTSGSEAPANSHTDSDLDDALADVSLL